MKTAIVIPNWNGADMIAECLESLQAQSMKAYIIVVDNGSTDESAAIIEQRFPNVKLIRKRRNHGFAGGVNIGIKHALKNGADAVALFNNDAVATKNWLEELVKQLRENPDAGIITGKLMRSDKVHIDSTGDYYSTWGISFPRGRNQKDSGQYDSVNIVFGASGGASLYNAKMFREVGLFDERFFAYFEDVDISFRAQLARWNVLYTPSAVAYHHVGGTSSKMGDFTRYHSVKNFLMLYTKNMPAWLFWKYLPFFLYQFARTTARSLVDLKPHVWLHSVLSFMGFLPSLLHDRHIIQKKRKLHPDQLEEILHVGRPPKIPIL